MPSSASTAYDYAAQLLALCDTLLAATPAGAPARQYVAPGSPAIDCETLCVWGANVGLDLSAPANPPASGHRHVYGWLNLIGFSIIIARDCMPVQGLKAGSPPLPADLDAAAQIVIRDAWVIWDGIPKAMADGTLFGGRCSELYMDSGFALPPAGGTAGWKIDLRANLQGITV